jgi:hypothetical protein
MGLKCRIGWHNWMDIGIFDEYSVDQCKECSKRRFWYILPIFAKIKIDTATLARMLDEKKEEE